ncbi:hypothetical protein L6164_023734 [Bauhinia variegata]|uniref:Uncharacterized protein n=1 Tax=Bauhinia variegata TaxID=167791 RepID=A0ACB9MJ42_BAUVA|nr:hypothetical protein L6164_023734 [Bauhinia variegata]
MSIILRSTEKLINSSKSLMTKSEISILPEPREWEVDTGMAAMSHIMFMQNTCNGQDEIPEGEDSHGCFHHLLHRYFRSCLGYHLHAE